MHPAATPITSTLSPHAEKKVPMTEAIAQIRDTTQALFILDPTAERIVDVSLSASRLLQYDRADLLGSRLDRIHPHDMPALQAFTRSVLSEGEAQSGNLSCLTRSGCFVPVMAHGRLLDTDRGPCILASADRIAESAHGVDTPHGAVFPVTNCAALSRAHRPPPSGRAPRADSARLVGSSASIKRVIRLIQLVAPTHATVLLTGESGTGKELAARAVHEWSPRATGPLVRVNCAAMPRDLFEAELFGYARGAFTGAISDRAGRLEAATGGTLFLDEIGELPLALQGKLLEVLQEGSYQRLGENRARATDLRVVAATNRNLHAEVTSGNFREDLYYRLNVFPVELPPLRDRLSDLDALAHHLASRAAERLGTPALRIDSDLLNMLNQYHWPGNIRELQNYIERATLLSFGGLSAGSPGQAISAVPDRSRIQHDHASRLLTESERRDLTRESILRALEASKGRIAGHGGAAGMLGVNPSTLRSRIKSYGIDTH